MKNKKIAIIHDWLSVNGGAELVLKHLLDLFPNADIYTMVDLLQDKEREWLKDHKVYTSCLQNIKWIRTHYHYFITFMPFLIEQFDLEKYDLIISSSHAVAKGVIIHPHQIHIAYIYSPMRYAWDLMYEHDHLKVFGTGLKRLLLKRWLHKMRIWDYVSAQRPDALIADSFFIQKRIKKCWAREAQVIYPPVELDKCIFSHEKENYYITMSRLVPYKRIDLIVEAFNQMPEKKLIIIGKGIEYNSLKKKSKKNIEFKGFLEENEAMLLISKAKAFIFMAKEDFGITPLEASACGTPVLAFGSGGASETVIHKRTGLHVPYQTVEALKETVLLLESLSIDPYDCFEYAQSFSVTNFKQNFSNYLQKKGIQ